jgi:PadR family transcriptional regulator AphA
MATSNAGFRYFTLGLLAHQPMSGYDIRRFLKSLEWLIGSPSFGIIYPALHALLEDGLVTMEVASRPDKPPRKIYSITEAGRQALLEWVDQPPASNANLKAFIMRLIPVGSSAHAGLIVHLQQRRAQVLAHQADLERIIADWAEGVDWGQRLAVDYGLAVASAELAWLDKVLVRLSTEPWAEEVIESERSVDVV